MMTLDELGHTQHNDGVDKAEKVCHEEDILS